MKIRKKRPAAIAIAAAVAAIIVLALFVVTRLDAWPSVTQLAV